MPLSAADPGSRARPKPALAGLTKQDTKQTLARFQPPTSQLLKGVDGITDQFQQDKSNTGQEFASTLEALFSGFGVVDDFLQTPFASPTVSQFGQYVQNSSSGYPTAADAGSTGGYDPPPNNPNVSVSPIVSRLPAAGVSETGNSLVRYEGRSYAAGALSVGFQLIDYVNRVAGSGLSVGSGYRSDSEQAGIASRDSAAGGGNAAAAGTSSHRTGNAIDFGVGGGASDDPRLVAAVQYGQSVGASVLKHKNCCGAPGYHVHIDFTGALQ